MEGWLLDELVRDALVISLPVIVVHELSYEVPKVPLAHRHDSLEAFLLDRPGRSALRARCSWAQRLVLCRSYTELILPPEASMTPRSSHIASLPNRPGELERTA